MSGPEGVAIVFVYETILHSIHIGGSIRDLVRVWNLGAILGTARFAR
jgi:hypothetical protein